MQFQLFLLCSLSHYQLAVNALTGFTFDYKYLRQNDSSIKTVLYQCTTNQNVSNRHVESVPREINSPLNPCNHTCCTATNSKYNQQTIVSRLFESSSSFSSSVIESLSSDSAIGSRHLSWSSVLHWHLRQLF
jgi:hypothetical protein